MCSMLTIYFSLQIWSFIEAYDDEVRTIKFIAIDEYLHPKFVDLRASISISRELRVC